MKGARRRRVDTDDEDEEEEEELSTEEYLSKKDKARLKELKRRESLLKTLLKKKQKSSKRKKLESVTESSSSDSSEEDYSEPRGSKKTSVKRKIRKKKKTTLQDTSTTDSSSKGELDSSDEYDIEPRDRKKSPVKKKKNPTGKKHQDKSAKGTSGKDRPRHSEKKITMVTISNTKDGIVTNGGDLANKEEVGDDVENKKPKQFNKRVVLTKTKKEDSVTMSDDSEATSPRDKHARREVKQMKGADKAKGPVEDGTKTAAKEEGTKGEEQDPKMQKDDQINIHCDQDDMDFIDDRVEDDIPTISLKGRYIENDMKLVTNFAKTVKFDIKKIKSEPSVSPCKYYNLSVCHMKNVQTHHTAGKEGFKLLYHICAICHASGNAHEAHPARNCPIALIKYDKM